MVSWDGVIQTADIKLAGFSPIVDGVAADARMDNPGRFSDSKRDMFEGRKAGKRVW